LATDVLASQSRAL